MNQQMNPPSTHRHRPIALADSALKKTGQTLLRGFLRRCPYCGGDSIFRNWFTLKERCPHCNTLFAYEDGYFLGSYVVNLGLTSLIAIAIVLWMLTGSDMSVLEMQIAGVILAVALPIFLFPYSLSFWMTLDLLLHPNFSDRSRK
jgi:uncharacterized protein (DUF983 family)